MSDSNESLDKLLEALGKKADNPAKLRATAAVHRHLFVWLNDDTSHTIARPLSHAGEDDVWGLPTTEPQLDPAITHLWVMHERTLLGWLWNGERWRELRELSTVPASHGDDTSAPS